MRNLRNKAAFSNFSGLKSIFIKLRFRDGLVWTVGLATERKQHFLDEYYFPYFFFFFLITREYNH